VYVRSAVPTANLGVLHVRRQRSEVGGSASAEASLGVRHYTTALALFNEALRIDAHDLSTRSNRAEVLMRLGRTDEAEREYRSILRIAPGNIDSLVGLAEMYIERGANGDRLMLEQAIASLDCAIDCIDAGTASKRVSLRNQASIFNLRGYACTRLLLCERGIYATGLATKALRDFNKACKVDPDLYAARHAAERVKAAFGSSAPVRWFESYVPLAIASLGVMLVLLSTLWLLGCFSIYRSKLHVNKYLVSLTPAEYLATVLSGIAMIIVGAYLPRLLKLKVAGVEIEKSTVDNIDTVSLMSISMKR
jgi:tetratricopeptide (TPR) repeat protein